MEYTTLWFQFDLCSLRHRRDVPLWILVIIYSGSFKISYSGNACHNNVYTGGFHAHTAAGWILHSIDDNNINYILRLLMLFSLKTLSVTKALPEVMIDPAEKSSA